jgi:hypothetical protein
MIYGIDFVTESYGIPAELLFVVVGSIRASIATCARIVSMPMFECHHCRTGRFEINDISVGSLFGGVASLSIDQKIYVLRPEPLESVYHFLAI